MRIQICLVVSAALLAGGVVFADEDISVPVRPIGVNGQEAWNGRATSFLYAPTFGFKAIAGAAKYRFTVNGKTFDAAEPTAALSPVWGEIPVGWVTVEARGVAADGRDLGISGSQRFWKKAAYRPGAYRPAARPYGKAAELARSCEERRLFNGRDLTGWYTYLKGRGRNCDPKGVFTVTNGVIHVTGEEFGALVTEKEYANYRLSLDYRFLGGEQFGGKAGWAPDSGILFHSTGPDGGFHGIWMESVEVNLIKGATGDFWGVGMNGSDRIALSARVGDELLSGKYPIHDPNGTKTYTIKGNTRICRSDIARDWTDTTGVADAVNERPIGEWNHVDLVCRGDEVLVFFNGKLVNRGFGVKPAKGRIQLQSEGCAIEFRDISIESLAKRSGGFIAGPKLARSDQVVGKASREEE